jgi:maleamate amidohydrolase
VADEHDVQVRIAAASFESLEHPGLVIVDCQRLFTQGPQTSAETDAALANIASVVEEARGRSVPVFYARTVMRSDEDMGPVWTTKVPALARLEPDSEASDIDPRVEPRPGEPVVEKRRASAFFGTNLAELLRDRSVQTVVVVGLTTSGCVRATAVDAASHDFKPVVLSDCVADRSSESHEVALSDLGGRYADVLPASTWLERLGA